ncbi:MAG: ATP-binding protein [Bryobacterales bacterium]|nr:ATP-binding protein [Bryobacterales bacterium]
MKELAVISGKGGTGKTSLVASFAALGQPCVLADCDVDAADLHLVLGPRNVRRFPFAGGQRAQIRPGHCTACGKCEEVCRFDAVFGDGPGNGTVERTFRIDPILCEGCGVCAWFCNEQAIEFGPVVNGHWFISETRCGPMVHARLGVAAENSGKLVSTVRGNAARLAGERGIELVISDGPPGIGCPVIACITGADLVLAVSEPTLSGLHDLERVAALAHHFGIPLAVSVNKWDLNPEITTRIEAWARSQKFALAGRIRYDPGVTAAQIRGMAVVEHRREGCAADIRRVWEGLRALLEGKDAACIAKSAFSGA